MKFLLTAYLTIACLLTITHAKLETDYWVRENVMSNFYGCKYAVSFQAMYCAKDTTKSYTCQCKDKVAQSAFVYCGISETKNNTSDLTNFLNMYNSKCEPLNKTFTLEKLYDIYDNATKYLETAKEYGKFNKTADILRTPLKYNHTVFKNAELSYFRRYQNESRGLFMGITVVAYWFAIFVIGAFYQVLAKLFPSINKNAKIQKLINGVWLKTYKQPIKVLGVELGFMPNKIESLVIGGSFIIIMVGACWGYRFHKNDVIWPKKYTQISRYIGDRTGHLSLFTMNLTFLFAGRNNFVLWATGWNFSGFLMYHKFIARCTVALIFAHTIAYVANSVKLGNYDTRHVQNYWIWGSVSIICGVVMVLTGGQVFRKRMYDVFVITHIILAVFFLIGAWFHLIKFDLQYYCYATIGVWSLDRVLRVVRMFVMFGGFRENKITIFKKATSNKEVDEEDLFLRIDVNNYNKKLFNIKDGNFGFVYILHPLGFWQSHPFTMVKISESEGFSLVLKVKKGLTKHIYKSISKVGDFKTFKICVEGPYGVSKNSGISKTENFSVITVGTGLSGPLCYLNHHRNSQLDEKSLTPNVLHWGVRSLAVVEAYKQELSHLVNKGNVIINIYCNKFSDNKTLSSSNNSTDSNLEKNDQIAEYSLKSCNSDEFLALDNVNIISNYMSVEQVVEEEMNASSSLTIMTCGLPLICDETRYQFLNKLSSKKGTYELIDDSQVW